MANESVAMYLYYSPAVHACACGIVDTSIYTCTTIIVSYMLSVLYCDGNTALLRLNHSNKGYHIYDAKKVYNLYLSTKQAVTKSI